MKNISKYTKGQVWFIKDAHLTKPLGCEQSKNRPWVIISSNECNQNNVILTVAPISTRSSERSYHVTYSDGNQEYLILLEQMTCKSVKRFELPGSAYMYSLTDSIMNKVDKAIKLHLGLKTEASEFINELQVGIDNIINTKLQELKSLESQYPVDIINQLTSKLDEIKIEIDNSRVLNSTSSNLGNIAINPKINKIELAQDEDVIQEVASTQIQDSVVVGDKTLVKRTEVRKKSHSRWSAPQIIKFLDDCNKYSLSEVALMYNLKSAKVVSQYRSKYRAYE